MLKRTLLLILIVLIVAGCSPSEPVATPTPTRTPTTEATSPPTATPTPITVAPTATPTEEAPAAELTPFPPGVNPLTGLEVEDPEMLEHAPLAIKISNSGAARPQSGLSSADLLFEHFAEHGITRFTAVFYGTYPERVGSVRSGRLIDLEVPAMYDALFAYSGSSAGVKERIRESDLFPAQIAAPDFGVGQPYFYRIPQEGKAFEHTLFADPEALRELAQERGVDEPPEFGSQLAFSEAVPNGGNVYDVDSFEINYSASAAWTYDAATGRWMRSTAGQVHRDALTGEQVSAANVAIVFANHVHADFWEEMIGDQSNWKLSIQIQIWGGGPALVFRDGKMIQGWWRRENRGDMLTFWDDAGNRIPLKPGNTWFQTVPLDTPTEEIEGGYRFDPPIPPGVP